MGSLTWLPADGILLSDRVLSPVAKSVDYCFDGFVT